MHMTWRGQAEAAMGPFDMGETLGVLKPIVNLNPP